jgi:predicted nucleotidyltransferase
MSKEVAEREPRFGIAERSFRLILDALRRRREVERAMLFGSRAMGTAKRGSDIDIAIDGPEVTADTARELSAELNERLPIPYYVDVLAYRAIEHRGVKEHIDSEGRELYRRSSGQAEGT